MRLWRYGDAEAPLTRPRHIADPAGYVLARVDVVGDCWVYQGKTNRAGYGRVGNFLAHRVVLASVQPQPDGKPYALHSCDNPPCVNPDHLWWGTQADNMQDMKAKGRGNGPYPRQTEGTAS